VGDHVPGVPRFGMVAGLVWGGDAESVRDIAAGWGRSWGCPGRATSAWVLAGPRRAN